MPCYLLGKLLNWLLPGIAGFFERESGDLNEEGTITSSGSSSQASIKRGWSSPAIAALLSFVVINSGFAAWLKIAHVDRFSMIAHNWGWWAVKSVLENQEPPDVMLMGSSLVQRLLDEGEATYLNQPLNGLEHRRCQHLEDKLSKSLGFHVSTFSYAIGGLHASDASVFTSEVLKGSRQPRAIVYGIAPRDIMNNMLASPYVTETYQIMSRIGDLSDVAYKSRMNTDEKFDYYVGSKVAKLFPLYDYRVELSRCFRFEYKAQTNMIANRFVPEPKNPFPLLEQITAGMIAEELAGKAMIPPFDPAHPQVTDAKNCYLFAYRPFRKRFYDVQFSFLERFLQITKQRGIQVVFVNMPLRQDNYETMMPGFYSLYRKDLQLIASKYGAPVIDMSQCSAIDYADFSDQVHLNGRGATKLIDALALELAPVLAKQSLANVGRHM